MIASDALDRVAELVALRTGLAFPAARRRDLVRGLQAAARDGGFDGPQAFVAALRHPATGDPCLDLLANHLTVGETYFHREQAGLQALRDTILPELVAERRNGTRQLRIWSAGCCTGEEPYSIAMVLREAVPDLANWRVTLLATDLSATFLERAAAGVYGSWSFRNVPLEVRRRYFTPTPERRHALSPEIRGLVTFARHNLVDGRPSLVADGQPMDVIFCCNVLMYFTPEQAARVVGELYSALAERGWLVVSPVEVATDLFTAFARVPVPGGTVLRRTAAAVPTVGPPTVAVPPVRPRTRLPKPAPAARPAQTARASPSQLGPAAAQVEEPARDAGAMAGQARLLANLGQLAEARVWAEKAVAEDRFSPGPCYLLATILVEQGEAEQAEASLRRALYLDPDHVLAHFALGHLARAQGRDRLAARHLRNALTLLSAYPPEEVIADADGLTAGRLIESLQAVS